MDLTVGSVLRNLVIQTNFFEFRNSQKFHDFRADGCLVDYKNGIFEKNIESGKIIQIKL